MLDIVSLFVKKKKSSLCKLIFFNVIKVPSKLEMLIFNPSHSLKTYQQLWNSFSFKCLCEQLN